MGQYSGLTLFFVLLHSSRKFSFLLSQFSFCLLTSTARDVALHSKLDDFYHYFYMSMHLWYDLGSWVKNKIYCVGRADSASFLISPFASAIFLFSLLKTILVNWLLELSRLYLSIYQSNSQVSLSLISDFK